MKKGPQATQNACGSNFEWFAKVLHCQIKGRFRCKNNVLDATFQFIDGRCLLEVIGLFLFTKQRDHLEHVLTFLIRPGAVPIMTQRFGRVLCILALRYGVELLWCARFLQ